MCHWYSVICECLFLKYCKIIFTKNSSKPAGRLWAKQTRVYCKARACTSQESAVKECSVQLKRSVSAGYKYMFDDKLVTVWSAPNYCYRCGNIASILEFKNVDNKESKLFCAVPDADRVIPSRVTTPYFLWSTCSFPPDLLTKRTIPTAEKSTNSYLFVVYFIHGLAVDNVYPVKNCYI